ncbi:MAG: HD domain-containing protein [bacterium]|nr:HD domain-containing protein [bacterium]
MLDEALVAEIAELHSGPDRGYHGWSHPLALLRLFTETEGAQNDPLAVYCAILLHDVIYEPRRSDNEARSAALAETMLKGVIPDDSLGRAIRLIEATARHAIPTDLPEDEAADMARFLDMDLSILAAPIDIFDAYEAGVRHEYRDVPEEAFRQGRAAILEGFLAREALYLSDWWRTRFEAKARENLKRSIARLRA